MSADNWIPRWARTVAADEAKRIRATYGVGFTSALAPPVQRAIIAERVMFVMLSNMERENGVQVPELAEAGRALLAELYAKMGVTP